MIDKELLGILVCPQNHTPLAEADAEVVRRLNQAIAAGRVRNRGGEAVRCLIDGGLIREDGAWLYPVVEGIPVLLIDDAIPLSDTRP